MRSGPAQEFQTDEEANAAAAEMQAQSLATKAPKKVKKTASDVLAAQLLQALSESQSTAQKLIQDKLEITTLVQGLSKTKTNAQKIQKLTKEDLIRFVDLYDVYTQDNGRARMVDLTCRRRESPKPRLSGAPL